MAVNSFDEHSKMITIENYYKESKKGGTVDDEKELSGAVPTIIKKFEEFNKNAKNKMEIKLRNAITYLKESSKSSKEDCEEPCDDIIDKEFEDIYRENNYDLYDELSIEEDFKN